MRDKFQSVHLVAKTQLVSTNYELPKQQGVYDSDFMPEYGGRKCYLSYNRPNPKTRENRDYLANIIEQEHESVFAHASFTFDVWTTRAAAHEIIRHRWLGFSEVSQRYVDPRKIMEFAGLRGDEFDLSAYDNAYRLNHYLAQSEQGLSGRDATKFARGIAREHLPLGFPTNMLVSGNTRAWRDFLKQRLSPHADAAIRWVAEEIKTWLVHEAPNSFQDVSKWT